MKNVLNINERYIKGMFIMNKTGVWGDVIYSDGEEEQVDPIMALIQKYEDLKNSKIIFLEGETIEQAKERRGHELYLIDKEIEDKIYAKRLRRG
jgi:hypothetical protein